jgi:hypothetical protein
VSIMSACLIGFLNNFASVNELRIKVWESPTL